MDRTSVQQVPRVSFLFPIALRDQEGAWDASDALVDFELSEFPTQPGALYEARFTGLRTADGELYNGGPFEVRFETAGIPDLLPMRPHSRVATRLFCRRQLPGGACVPVVVHADSTGDDSLRVHRTCEDCTTSRDDWFRLRDDRIEWLGWDDLDQGDVVTRSVRWPQAPPLLSRPTTKGAVLGGAAQTASDGTSLLRWRAVHLRSESPSYPLSLPGGTVEVVYSRSTVIELDFALRLADGIEEAHLERWWLLPGIGIVRREQRIERAGTTRTWTEIFTPSLANLQ
jgi:hypothetical protein